MSTNPALGAVVIVLLLLLLTLTQTIAGHRIVRDSNLRLVGKNSAGNGLLDEGDISDEVDAGSRSQQQGKTGQAGQSRGRYIETSSSSSGARSVYPLAAIGSTISDSFNLINLFNVFRGYKSKLVDEYGNLIPLDQEVSSQVLPSSAQSPFISNLNKNNDLTNKLISTSKNKNQGAEGVISSPVILVPGYGGSRLEARLDKPSVVRYFCDLKSDWTDIWVNVKLLLPYMIDCLIDNMRLEFDHKTNTTKNTAGVEIRVKNATQISSVEYLHNLPLTGFAYFAPISDKLVDSLGYQRELSIHGAPYDFRKAPNELGEYFKQLKGTTEKVFEKNQRKPATFICHSMGCNNMLYFFHHQSQDWKDTYVKRLISIAAPWGGSLSALRATALGDDLGMPYLFSESKLILVQRSLPSTIYLFPHKEAFPNVPLIRANVEPTQAALSIGSEKSIGSCNSAHQANCSLQTNSIIDVDQSNQEKVYRADDYKQFFDDINHPDGYQMWLNTKDLLGSLEAPGVEVWCVVGRGLKTLGRMEYTGEFPDSPSLELYDDGDGTVSMQSASYCRKWSKKQKQPVYYKEFDASHMEILKDARVLDYVQRIVDDNEILSETRKLSN